MSERNSRKEAEETTAVPEKARGMSSPLKLFAARLEPETPAPQDAAEAPAPEASPETPEVTPVAQDAPKAAEPSAPAEPEPATASATSTPDAPTAPAATEETPAAPPAASARRSSRVKTTFLGFERSDGRIEDVFEKEKEKPATERHMFPVGWIVITDGPGCGTSLTIQAGVSQIGRGEDQAIQLDFGDMGISRSNHAAIAYDDEENKFFLGHGGKSNIVRLNGKPVLSTEPLEDGDIVRIGETTMTFVAFCGDEFNWSDS